MSSETDKIKCAYAVKWYFALPDKISSVTRDDMTSPNAFTGDCLYYTGDGEEGDAITYGSPSGGDKCASVKMIYQNDDEYYITVNDFYLRADGYSIVLSDVEGDLFYSDSGNPRHPTG